MADTPDPRTPYSQWTVDTLHEHYCKMFELTKENIAIRFEAQERATLAAQAAANKATDKAERLADIRYQVQADASAGSSERVGLMVTKSEYQSAHNELVKKIDALSTSATRHVGVSEGERVTMGKLYMAVAAVGIIAGVVVILVEQVAKLGG